MKKIVMVIAPEDFRDEEYSEPREVFEKKGFEVKVASNTKELCTGKLGMKVKPDILLSEVNADIIDALVFVGGPGSTVYFDNPVAHKLAQDIHKNGKIVAAICIAPMILVNAGILSNKSATVYPSEEKNMKAKGVKYTGKPVEVSQTIITANGPEAAKDFGKKIVEALV